MQQIYLADSEAEIIANCTATGFVSYKSYCSPQYLAKGLHIKEIKDFFQLLQLNHNINNIDLISGS